MTNTTPQYHTPLVIKYFNDADYSETHTAMSARTLERIRLAKEDISTPDELWIVEHNDVYTLGQAGKESHILRRTETPIIKTDRGGQVTWHGRGQLVVYYLFDLKSLGWSVRDLVSHAEQAIEDVINTYLQSADDNTLNADSASIVNTESPQRLYDRSRYGYYAKARKDAPGVYIYARAAANQALNQSAHTSVQTDEPATETFSDDGDIMLGKIASLGFKIKHGMSYHGIAVNLTCDLAAFLAINPCGYEGMTMLRLSDFLAIDYQQVTEALIANISARHQGQIALRATQ